MGFTVDDFAFFDAATPGSQASASGANGELANNLIGVSLSLRILGGESFVMMVMTIYHPVCAEFLERLPEIHRTLITSVQT